MPYIASELVDVVRQLAEHQAAMVRELATLRFQLDVKQADGDESALLIAIDMAMGDRAFIASELMAAALGGSPAATLLAAHVAGKSVKALGKRLGAIAGKRTPAGLMLVRIGTCSEGGIWRLSKSQTPAD